MASRRTIGRRLRRSAPALVLPLLVLAAGCSSDEGAKAPASTTTTTIVTVRETTTTRAPIDPSTIEGGNQAYVDAMLAGLATMGGSVSRDQAECIAPKWVEIIGVAGFAKAGIAPEDFAKTGGGLEQLHLDAKTAGKMADVFETCGMNLKDMTIEAQASGAELPDSVVACIREALTDEGARAGFIASLTGQQATDPSLAKAAACGEAMIPEETVPGG
jgi:hypothetical protein